MILILGGTSESIEIAQNLNELGIPYFLSTATDYGGQLAKKVAQNVQLGRLSAAELSAFIKKHQIKVLLDATHPFASAVSRNAMEAAAKNRLPYLRFERPSLVPDGIVTVSTIEEACQFACKASGKIYLTTGSKNLPEFLKYLPIQRVIARVLPTAEVLTFTERLGLRAEQIEAIRGPFSTEMNRALMRRNQASVLITKESGKAGGFLEKLAACKDLEIPAIVLTREKLNYPHVFEEIPDLIEDLKQRFLYSLKDLD
ncbi:precorrin-6A reductase [Enterococcus casseliflavus]|uniref:Precorrin-6A reductase n=1 Tax=Enterococcus casseliflavus TaxID=37734 RepID=A0A415EU78_ENTCA|nr:precorrin-6A reductase [Enterococcus casseliflavus]